MKYFISSHKEYDPKWACALELELVPLSHFFKITVSID